MLSGEAKAFGSLPRNRAVQRSKRRKRDVFALRSLGTFAILSYYCLYDTSRNHSFEEFVIVQCVFENFSAVTFNSLKRLSDPSRSLAS